MAYSTNLSCNNGELVTIDHPVIGIDPATGVGWTHAAVAAWTLIGGVYSDSKYATSVFTFTPTLLASPPAIAPAGDTRPWIQSVLTSANTTQPAATYYWRVADSANAVLGYGWLVISAVPAV